MPDVGASSFSETDASNNSASPNGAAEGMAPSGVNDTIRAVMGGVKRWYNRITGTVTSGGAAQAQTLTYTVDQAALVTGERKLWIAGFTNTGAAPTLKHGGLTAKPMVNADNTAFIGGEVQAGHLYETVYDGTSERVLTLTRTRGSWTPVITFGSGSTTYTTQLGRYERVGNLVWFAATITTNAVSTPSGTVNIGPLPFAGQTLSGLLQPVSLRQSGLNVTGLTNPFNFQAYVASAATTVTLEVMDTAGAGLNTGTTFGNGDTIQVSGVYRTDV